MLPGPSLQPGNILIESDSCLILCRKGYQDYICRDVEYISGHRDDTLIGSRPFFQIGIGYVLYRALGLQGHTDYVRTCIAARDRLAKGLMDLGDERVRVVHASPYVNLLALEVSIEDGRIPKDVVSGRLGKYFLRHDLFPGIPEEINSCPRTVYKICVMPHTIGYIDDFVGDLKEVLTRA